MTFGKPFDMNELTLSHFNKRPRQRLNALVRRFDRSANETIAFDGRIVDFIKCLNHFHHLHRGIPGIYEHRLKRQTFDEVGIAQHLQKMLEFGLAISVNVIETIVDNPIGLRLGVDINTCDDTDTFNDTLL